MSKDTENLWEIDFKPADVRTTKSLLDQQAGLLEKLTNGVLYGSIHTEETPLEGDFKHEFRILAPGLGGYSYKLFVVRQPLRMYPLTIESEVFDRYKKCKNEIEFRDALKEILRHKSTKQVVNAMIAQSL